MATTSKTGLRKTYKKPDLNPMLYGKLPPQAPELEGAILGAIMVDSSKLSDVLDVIQSPDCFYTEANKRIYGAIRRLFDKGSRIDFITVAEELKRENELELAGGYYYVTSLTKDVVSTANIEEHARIVMQKFIMRELIRMSGEIISEAYEDSSDVFDLLDKAESNLYEITDKHLRRNFNSIDQIVIKTLKEIQEARDKKEDITGVPSGFSDLDKLTGGWQKTDLIILAARPAVGKTAFSLNLVMNAALHKTKPTAVAFFSLEMSASQLVKRMLSATTEVPLEKITKGNLLDHEIVQIQTRMSGLTNAKIFIDDQAALNIFELRAKCRRLKQKENLGMVVIDYLQLMTAHSDNRNSNREQEISKISRDLKALAKELEIPIIALSQLNRAVESRKESKMPQLSDLRESGAIEQDADVVMFLYRPEYHMQQTGQAPIGENPDMMGEPGETRINVAKHRNGQTDVIKVRADLSLQKFHNFVSANLVMPGIPDVSLGKAPTSASAGMKPKYDVGPTLHISTANTNTTDDETDNAAPWDDNSTDGQSSDDSKAPDEWS